MDDNFFAYLQQLELIAFFSGYPLIYAATLVLTGNQQLKKNFISTVPSLLPIGYALVGTLFLGYQLKKLYPDYSLDNIQLTFIQPWLVIWGILSMLFYIPALSKRRVLSLIHSLAFLFLLLRDFFFQFSSSSADKSMMSNTMKMYIDSLILNTGTIIIAALLYFLFKKYKARLKA